MEKEKTKSAKAVPEEATTVGMFLKYTRESQKKTIEMVAKHLCIRKIYIKAIEESDFDELPPVPYGIGFIRSYAEYLGLNSDRIVQCYKEEAMPKKTQEPAKPIVKKHTSLTIPNRRQILIGLGSIFFIYLLWLIAGALSSDDKHANESNLSVDNFEEYNTVSNNQDLINVENISVTEIEPVEKADSATENPQIIMLEDSYYDGEIAGEPSQETPKAQSRAALKLNGESWVEVRDSEKVYISGIFQKGYEYEIPNVPGLILSVGRYYNVDVYIDGKLTQVARPTKQTKIPLDKFLNH